MYLRKSQQNVCERDYFKHSDYCVNTISSPLELNYGSVTWHAVCVIC